MKIKLLKTLAVVFAICLTFAGFSAFAADVEIVTSYDYTQAADASVSVSAKVKNMTSGNEVSYYVSNGDEIVYINQATADANGVAQFDSFSAPWNTLTASTVVFGSDAGKSWSGFTFVPAGNYKTEGTATATASDTAWAVETTEEGATGYSYTAKVSGNYSEYGIKVTIDSVEIELPALGCSEDGTYTVFVGSDGATAPAITNAVAYAK